MESRDIMDIMDYEKEICRKFDTGQFNDIAIAYLILALQAADISTDQAKTVLNMYGHLLDDKKAEEVLWLYRGNTRSKKA